MLKSIHKGTQRLSDRPLASRHRRRAKPETQQRYLLLLCKLYTTSTRSKFEALYRQDFFLRISENYWKGMGRNIIFFKISNNQPKINTLQMLIWIPLLVYVFYIQKNKSVCRKQTQQLYHRSTMEIKEAIEISLKSYTIKPVNS